MLVRLQRKILALAQRADLKRISLLVDDVETIVSEFTVRLGNINPLHVSDFDGKEIVTTIIIPDDVSVDEAFITVTDPNGVWSNHSTANPTWVSSTNSDLASRLADHYNCPISAE